PRGLAARAGPALQPTAPVRLGALPGRQRPPAHRDLLRDRGADGLEDVAEGDLRRRGGDPPRLLGAAGERSRAWGDAGRLLEGGQSCWLGRPAISAWSVILRLRR